jgi:hypothetical protein
MRVEDGGWRIEQTINPPSSILDNFVFARLKIFLASPLNLLAHFIPSKIESGLP